MKIQRSRVGRVGLVVALASLAVLPAIAGTRGREANPVSERVREALEAELRGAGADRAAALASAIEAAPDDAAARWLAGFVKQDGQWVPHEAVAKKAAADKVLAEYTKRRDRAGDTVAGQLELADWCRKNKLAEQEQAHLMAGLQLAPNHVAVRARLGHVRVGDVWLDEKEVREGRERAREAGKALAQYRPMLEEIRDSLAASKLRRDVAVKQLAEIDDPSGDPGDGVGAFRGQAKRRRYWSSRRWPRCRRRRRRCRWRGMRCLRSRPMCATPPWTSSRSATSIASRRRCWT